MVSTLSYLSRGAGEVQGGGQKAGSLCWAQPLCSSCGPVGPGLNLEDQQAPIPPGRAALGELVFQTPPEPSSLDPRELLPAPLCPGEGQRTGHLVTWNLSSLP